MFTVVVPTKNRPQDLENFLNSVQKQTLLPQKIVIVDQSDIESSVDFSADYADLSIEYLYNPKLSGLCAAKNYGIKHMEGDFCFFFDDDIILDDNFFEVIIGHFHRNPNYHGICGRQKNSKSSKIKVFAFELFHRGPFRDIRKKCNSGYVKKAIVPTKILPGGITAYTREVLEKYSFDETLIKYCLGEDMDFSYRVSQEYPLAFAMDALALHNHSTIGRYDALESYACKVAGYAFFYEKNVKKGHKLSRWLVNFGIVFDALTYSLKKRNLIALRGIRKGKQYVINGFAGVPFIEEMKVREVLGQ